MQRKTAKDRFSRALREINRWCRAHRHWRVPVQQLALSRKLQGHYAYYGITGNARALARFLYAVRRLWRKWLNRRSWHVRMSWDKFAVCARAIRSPNRAWFTVFIVAQRRHSPRSRMPESGTSGSAGAAGG